MSEHDDLSQMMERLAAQAPPAPAGSQIRARLQSRRLRRHLAVGVFSLAVGLPLALVAWPGGFSHLHHPPLTHNPEMVVQVPPTGPAITGAVPDPASGGREVPLQPKVAPVTMPIAAIDPALGSQAVVDAIVACLQPPADANLLLWKDHGILEVTGTSRLSHDRLATLDHLLGRVTALDLRFTPGLPPHLCLLIANHHA